LVSAVRRGDLEKRVTWHLEFPFGKRGRPIFNLSVEPRNHDWLTIEIPGLDFNSL